MKKEQLLFTVGQFAGLHHLNKRTLHYYDEIGLFSPARKGENEYRYYTYSQSADLENILALRELGMSIEEIKDYLAGPDPGEFRRIASQKIAEIDAQIKRLKQLKALLRKKQEALVLCDEIQDGKIEVVRRPDHYLLLTPMRIEDEDAVDMERIMQHLQEAWNFSTHKAGCGSYLALDKAQRGEFEVYDGLFTPVDRPGKSRDFLFRPKGPYLCGYHIGDWDQLSPLYGKMFEFAEEQGLELTGNCYETGLNEFAISRMEDYVTMIEIACVDRKATQQ